MKTIKIFKTALLLALLAFSPTLFAQEAEEQAKPEAVKGTFGCGVAVNNQTIETLNKNELEMMIQHRFGLIKDQKDLYGIFAPSNIRLGISYGIIKDLTVGIGATKTGRIYNVEGKYRILKQAAKGGMPLSLTFFGDISLSALPKDQFLNQDSAYVFSNRLTYFAELMVARKITKGLSVQLAANYTHLNIVEDKDSVQNRIHDYIGTSIIARYKFSPQSSVLVEFDYPLTKAKGVYASKPNLGISYELSTGSHQFQIFVCSASGIMDAETRTNNFNDFTKGDFLIGFNITRQWGL